MPEGRTHSLKVSSRLQMLAIWRWKFQFFIYSLHNHILLCIPHSSSLGGCRENKIESCSHGRTFYAQAGPARKVLLWPLRARHRPKYLTYLVSFNPHINPKTVKEAEVSFSVQGNRFSHRVVNWSLAYLSISCMELEFALEHLGIYMGVGGEGGRERVCHILE